MKEFNLRPRRGGQYGPQENWYDANVKPEASHALASASFRFAHSMVPDTLYEDLNRQGEQMSPNSYQFAHFKFRT